MGRTGRLGLALVAWLCSIGITDSLPLVRSHPASIEAAPQQRTARDSAKARALKEPGIENLFSLGDRLYSGGQPEGDAGFDTLQKLGIRTIISVDGTPPDLDAAQQRGMRYVHLPIGYDGLRRDKLPLMIKAARELPGPIYIHCHHGRHRGPAAAGACAIATEKWTRSQAAAWLKQAGTDPAYRGLYRDVNELAIPTEEETSRLPPDFPESVPAPSLVEAMLGIDRLHDELRSLGKQGWKPNETARSAPAEVAVQLLEQFRELGRSSETEKRGTEFALEIEQSINTVDQLRRALERLASEPAALAEASRALERMGTACKSCHSLFRDN